MGIEINIPTAMLGDARVAQAVTQLLAELGRTSPVAGPVVAVPAAPVSPVRARETAYAAAPRPAAPAPAAPRPAPTSAPISFEEFESQLPDRSRRFLELVRERGVIRLSEVVVALDLPTPKAVGGITGAIGRWGPERGLVLPYETTRLAGERAWRWVGNEPSGVIKTSPAVHQQVEETDADDSEDDPAGEQALLEAEPEAEEEVEEQVEEANDEDWTERLRAALPEPAARFIALLEERGQVTMTEVLDNLGLARAIAVTDLLQSIRREAKKLNIAVPFESTNASSGERMFRLPGLATEEPKAPARAVSFQPIEPLRVRKRR